MDLGPKPNLLLLLLLLLLLHIPHSSLRLCSHVRLQRRRRPGTKLVP